MLTKTENIHRRGLGKSVAHGLIQHHLKNQITALELEKNLGKRRADAVWEDKKIVFEIQLSPISLQEVLRRCSDYSAQGYQVVWILHEGVFNGAKVSPAEKYLRKSCPTYFTNGEKIYDQLEVVSGRRRLYQGEPLAIKISEPCIPFIRVPERVWPLHFIGDTHTLCATSGVKEVRATLQKHRPPEGFRWWLQFIGLRILELVSTNQK
jgi:hypothetical protein